MAISLGLVELKSVPAGIETADEMLKAANVQLLLAAPICPGKYIIIISGNVGAVKSAMQAGVRQAGSFLVTRHSINNVHDDIPAAITGTADIAGIRALGVVETITALTAVIAGDIAAKAANIQLMEIRVARGLGGKGFLIFSGEVSAVKSALASCLNDLQESGEITSTCVLPAPHPQLVQTLLAQH